MKPIFFIALALIPLVCTNDESKFITEEFVNQINSMQSQWTAGNHFNHVPLETIRSWLGVVKRPNSRSFRFVDHEDTGDDIPDSYDVRDVWPNCSSVKEIADQSACKSCWAVSTASSMSDRICIASKGKQQTRISANHIMSCCVLCGDGCNGGEPINAWDYWRTDGIVTGGLYGSKTGCQPYPFKTCEHHDTNGSHPQCPADLYTTPDCKSTCDTKDDFTLTFGIDSYRVKGEVNMQKEILKNGPIVADFDVYTDFVTYSSGIYEHQTGDLLDGHAVRVIGWGVESKVKYWLIANSWNEDWGDKGTVKMIRGKNDCGLEEDCSAGLPKL